MTSRSPQRQPQSIPSFRACAEVESIKRDCVFTPWTWQSLCHFQILRDLAVAFPPPSQKPGATKKPEHTML